MDENKYSSRRDGLLEIYYVNKLDNIRKKADSPEDVEPRRKGKPYCNGMGLRRCRVRKSEVEDPGFVESRLLEETSGKSIG